MEKKTLHAAEQHREDVIAERAEWKTLQETLPLESLGFIDETWTKTIENVFSKLKTLVRKLKLRKQDELWKKLGELCDMFSPDECKNYCRHAGYTNVQTNF